MAETVETKQTGEVSLSSPWITAYKKLNALFDVDPDIDVLYDDEKKTITLESTNTFKMMALEKILVPELKFGNITVKIECLVKNGADENISALFKTAFNGNPHFSQVIDAQTPYGEQSYVLFKKEVLQFFNDDTSDYYGNWNGLSEDILREVVNENIRVNIGTEVDPVEHFDSIWDDIDSSEE